jgi:glycosyltransferase involved in cell wall biosynthesis
LQPNLEDEEDRTMGQVTVSAVIPVYNNGPYIAAALESVLAQTRPANEIIVVDDGSTDGTAAALVPYRGRVRYVYQQNRGEPAARNTGIREATSDYIAFLDGDDLWVPNKLELQLAYLARHPECALVYGDMSTFDSNGTIDASVKQRFRMTLPSGRIFKSLFMRSLFGSGTVLFRKSCLDTVGHFDEEFLVGSDYEMWLRIARHFELGAVDQPLLMYRFHDAMATRGLGLKLRNGVPWEAVVIDKILRLYPEAVEELGRSVVKRRLSKPWAGLGSARFHRNDHKGARPLLRKAIEYWPTNLSYWMFYGATFLHPAHIMAVRRLYRTLPLASGTEENGERLKAKAA